MLMLIGLFLIILGDLDMLSLPRWELPAASLEGVIQVQGHKEYYC